MCVKRAQASMPQCFGNLESIAALSQKAVEWSHQKKKQRGILIYMGYVALHNAIFSAFSGKY